MLELVHYLATDVSGTLQRGDQASIWVEVEASLGMSEKLSTERRSFILPENLDARLKLLRYRQEDTESIPLLEGFRLYTAERAGAYSFVAVDEKLRPHPLVVTGTYFYRRRDESETVNEQLEREAFSELTRNLVKIAWRRLYPSRWQQLLNRHRLAIKTAVAVAIASAALVIIDAASTRMNIFGFVNALCERLGDFGAKNVGMITGCIRLFFVLAITSVAYWIANIIGARRHPIMSVDMSEKTLKYCYGPEACRVIEDVEKGNKQTCIPGGGGTPGGASTVVAARADAWRGYDNFVSYEEFQKRVRIEAKRASRFASPVSCLIVSLEPAPNDAKGPVKDIEAPVREKCTQVMWHEIREIDTAARYGENGFIVLLPNTDAKGAQTVEKRLRSKLESCNVCERCIADTAAIRTGTSAVATTEQGLQWEEIIRQAESALLASPF
jgi:diguanylate cyclase (GGDEF)-like protein